MNSTSKMYAAGLLKQSRLNNASSTHRRRLTKNPFIFRRNGPSNRMQCLSTAHWGNHRQMGVALQHSTRQLQPTHRCLSSFSGAARSESLDDAIASLPPNAQLQFDFFGEPVTFVGVEPNDKTANAMAALDGFILAVVTKGRTCTGGGAEEGLEMRSAHASAIAWAELLRHAKVWNSVADEKEEKEKSKSFAKRKSRENMQDADISGNNKDEPSPENGTKANNPPEEEPEKVATLPKFAPMLVVAAVAPALVQAGKAYVKFLDDLLEHGDSLVPGMGPLQMMPLVEAILARKDDKALNDRERQHIEALGHLMKYDNQTALWMYLKILRSCPGDMLAMSLAIDLAYTLGDKSAARRAASSVASYWNERQGGFIQASIPGYNISSAWQAVGLAVGGQFEEAEQIAERTMNRDKRNAGAVATWALSHIFDAGGRVSEGISFLANHDGVKNYDGSGLLFFDCRLSGYGALYSIDREQRGRGRSAALRLYDTCFDRIFEYSGFSIGKAWTRPQRKAPIAWVERDNDIERSRSATFLNNLLGGGKSEKDVEDESQTHVVVRETLPPSMEFDNWDPSCEDVLTWLPPTPTLLTEGTLLMFRLTLNGSVSTKDRRWDSLRNSWKTLLELQKDEDGHATTLKHFPLACLAASILLPTKETGGDEIGNGRMAAGLNLLGYMLSLGNQAFPDEESDSIEIQTVADIEPDFWLPAEDEVRKEWKEIVDHLASGLDGTQYQRQKDGSVIEVADSSLRFESWDFTSRPVMEHALCYAACRTGDTDSLSTARAISSQGVTLRRNSPEEWWRYSIIVGLLGDQIASENALQIAVNIGSGQGQRD